MQGKVEKVKVDFIKDKLQRIKLDNDTIHALKTIIAWEKENTGNTFGWRAAELNLPISAFNKLRSVGLLKEGYKSSNYTHWWLIESPDVVEQALDEIMERMAKKQKHLFVPFLSEEDEMKFSEILKTYDALDYWSRYVAPHVAGHERVKRLILVQIASPDDKKHSRGRIHLLLEGEPGTGKTMFREWVTYEIGAEYASMRSTGAGLTRDMRTGEPGALERAHETVWRMLTLEELRDWDRSELELLKEAMSEGKYPLQGAGVNEIVPAMVRVLACTNEIDSKKFSPQFLNRFDVIVHFERPTKEQANPIIDKMVDDFMSDEEDETDVETLKKYLWWVKKYHPPFDKSAREKMKILIKIYKDGKYEDGEKVDLRTTVGGILRIAYTIARLNRRPVDPLRDCIEAIRLADPKFQQLKLEGMAVSFQKLVKKLEKEKQATLS